MTAMRAASLGCDACFHPRNFVATWHDASVQEYKNDGLLEDGEERPDLADQDNFGRALMFSDSRFSSLSPSALDDVFLSMRRKDGEMEAEHTARLNWFFDETFVHYCSAEDMNALVNRCQLPSNIASSIFPNIVYNPSKNAFFPRPLHVAVLADHIQLGKLMLHFVDKAKCASSSIFLSDHTPGTNFAEMSPLLTAILFSPDRTLPVWLGMLARGGARFNKLDSCVVGNIVAHDQMTDQILTTFRARVRRALVLSGAVERTRARFSDIAQRTPRFRSVRRRLRGKQAPVTDTDALNLALCHFEDNGFDDSDTDPLL